MQTSAKILSAMNAAEEEEDAELDLKSNPETARKGSNASS
jgi:hypothetical protein